MRAAQARGRRFDSERQRSTDNQVLDRISKGREVKAEDASGSLQECRPHIAHMRKLMAESVIRRTIYSKDYKGEPVNGMREFRQHLIHAPPYPDQEAYLRKMTPANLTKDSAVLRPKNRKHRWVSTSRTCCISKTVLKACPPVVLPRLADGIHQSSSDTSRSRI